MEDILIKNSDFQQLAGKSTNKWHYFNDKTISYWMLPKLQSNAQKSTKTICPLVKEKHTIKHK
ncbi:hypothetical protein [Spiroplasma poulsonii]|uniref:hypothetical protein n=1 Tax=Spiroplasma poulsonii TaxID=2138 RepID=UPI001F4D3254|nr:hypothetical protein [Spiroplasma poulsonii]UNF61383.1 hypothetical protein MNU24_05560 [Spiroplasma poulsonii]